MLTLAKPNPLGCDGSRNMTGKDGMLLSIQKINEQLAPDKFCVPPYNSVNGGWVNKCFGVMKTKPSDLKYLVTAEIVLPWRRAYQTAYFYTDLEPFKSLVKVIDAATLAYYSDNFFCSYMALIPVVEGVLDRWGKEDIPNYNPDSAIRPRIELLFNHAELKLNHDIYWHQYLLIQHAWLQTTLANVFFAHGSSHLKKGHTDGFNRSVMSHMLAVPDMFDSNVHSLRVFLLLDVLAILYAATHSDKHPGISPVRDLTNKPELMNKYWGIYKSCASKTIMEGSYNLTLESHIYKPSEGKA